MIGTGWYEPAVLAQLAGMSDAEQHEYHQTKKQRTLS